MLTPHRDALEGRLMSTMAPTRPVVDQIRYHVRATFSPNHEPGEALSPQNVVLCVWCAECSCDVPRYGALSTAMSQLDLRMTMQDHDRLAHSLSRVDYPVVTGA
jgi:hypothetical protein